MTTTLPPGTRFEVDHIFLFDDARMDALESGHDAALAAGDLWIDLHDRDRVIADGALCLAIRASWFYGPVTPEYPYRKYTAPVRGWLVDSDPRIDRVDHLARNTRVASFREEPATLVPFGSVSLGEMIDSATRERNPGARAFDFLDWDLPIDPTPEAVAAAEKGWFAGLWHVCSCGDWGDVADFVLVQDFEPVLRVGTNCGGVWQVEAFPAKLDDAAAATRRTERAALVEKRQTAEAAD